MTKKLELAKKQAEADKDFDEFRMKHPYMSDEELELYHKHHEIVPFFHSREEKAAWK